MKGVKFSFAITRCSLCLFRYVRVRYQLLIAIKRQHGL